VSEHNPEISGLRVYSIGRAANNKALNSKELEITPIEQLNMLDGELVSLPFDSEVSGQKADGSEYSAKVTLNTALTATWFPMHSNRKTPPDIRRGERVIIWRYKDTDQYYWTETGWDDHLRRLETVHLRWSATADEKADMEDPSNWYHLSISTHEGLIHLETMRANKEKAKYALQINTKEGIVALADDFGNIWQLESVENIISFQNGDGSLWQLDKKKIYGYAPDLMHCIAENKIHFQTKDFLLECQTGNIDASASFKIKTPDFQVESSQNTFTSPSSIFTGNVEIGGTFAGSGAASFSSPMTANGITSSAPIVGPSNTI
jgi:hypothetical protein